METGQYERNTGTVPDWYADRPETLACDDLYMEAFWELSTTRQFGHAIGPIPWHQIVQYGVHRGLDPVMIRVLERVVRTLDEAWLEWQRDNQKRRTEQTKPKAKHK